MCLLEKAIGMHTTQISSTCSKVTVETLEKCVKYV